MASHKTLSLLIVVFFFSPLLVLEEPGVLRRVTWSDGTRRWSSAFSVPQDQCDNYARCGPFGVCDPVRLFESECTCLPGFEPRSARDWHVGDWSRGCVRRRPLDCGRGHGFLRLARVKLPDTSRSRVEPGLSLKACEDECLKNCTCTAYANADISGAGSGCVIWDGDVIDLKVYSDGGQDFYTRVDASELDGTSYKQSRGFLHTTKIAVSVSTIVVAMIAFISCGYYCWRKERGSKRNIIHRTNFFEKDFEECSKGSTLSWFHSDVIVASTNNFSEANMLGKGGFGPVYKGKLLNGEEIAVKRLSKNSGQGGEEFKNEVTLIAKLQHKNLVRLLGCCIEGEEKMLIYEYMENRSLDCFIFDKRRSALLDWNFGLARVSDGNQTQEITSRVVGTYGYMSPEYAMKGRFSIKSDVFSFGIVLLEIISGKRNNYYSDCYSMTLIEHTWNLWKEDKVMELVDSSISDSCCQIEVARCIQVGLLCVQESAKDRPNMSSVVFMLGNETQIPSPQQPAFCLYRGESCHHLHSLINEAKCSSKNEGADVGFAPPAASKPAASDRPVFVADPLLAFNVAPKVGDLEAVDLKGKRVFVRADLNVLLDDKVADLNVADLKGEIYLTYVPYDSSMPSRLVLDESGSLIRLVWIDNTGQWNLAKLVPKDECDNYGRCGPYGICDPAGLPESECTCLPGFEPRSDRDWHVGDWSRGCVRRRPLDCGKGDGFLRLARVKLPDTSRSRVEAGLSLKACEDECLKDCSCTAYASANISGEGKGCVMWGGDLIDLKVYSDGGQDFYTRVDASELDETSYKQSRGFFPTKKIVVSVSTIVAVAALVSCGYYCWKRGRGRKMNTRHHTMFNEKDFEEGNKDSALSWFQSDVIVASTNNFSEANMLGKGGFGSVYKGKLLNGETIAVKRLSKNSGQGGEEFKNEKLRLLHLRSKEECNARLE
ncbi:hypothetical protein AAC387_Pa10g1001 [Persea americana]